MGGWGVPRDVAEGAGEGIGGTVWGEGARGKVQDGKPDAREPLHLLSPALHFPPSLASHLVYQRPETGKTRQAAGQETEGGTQDTELDLLLHDLSCLHTTSLYDIPLAVGMGHLADMLICRHVVGVGMGRL